MKVELFPFQKKAVLRLRENAAEALGSYRRTSTPQVLSLQAPTGAGKTIVMAALIEDIYFGNDRYDEQPEAIFVWLSDSPALNEQSKRKIDLKADRIRLGQCVTIEDESFDRETLEDGRIYFLNTQKLGKAGNLGRHSDTRQYTIWETLANTAREKADRLYFIIDEAHRGMQGREAGRATSIMQRFLKGCPELMLPPMPLTIGVSATAARFHALVGDTNSTLHKCIITADEVRASGLLKDRIVITYPDDPEKYNEMAVLGAAADEWKSKCEHWAQYSTEQHYAQVNPVFVIQVLAGSGNAVSDTGLDAVLATIEERIGKPFRENEVVHTFGSTGTIKVNGLSVPHIEPSDITEDKRIRVVFFKENLSTGWDCPRAETMMSFRKAEDATYIAQLLGRMVRTPLQCHIDVDESLNDVRLYLPHFNMKTVGDVVNELQSAEGGEIPTVVEGESLERQLYVPWSIHPTRRRIAPDDDPNQLKLSWDPAGAGDAVKDPERAPTFDGPQIAPGETREIHPQQTPTVMVPLNPTRPRTTEAEGIVAQEQQLPQPVGKLDREGIAKFINEQGFATYHVRDVRINNYLKSLLNLAGILTQYNIFPSAKDEVENEVVGMIRDHVETLQRTGKYDGLAKQALSFKLSARTFDVFGESLDQGRARDWVTCSEGDLDRQLRAADARLGGYGFPNEYGRRHGNLEKPLEYKIDCILFVADDECMAGLNRHAERKFHELNDRYRKYVVTKSERCKKQYADIISDGDAVSKHNLSLPEIISARPDADGKEYQNHLFLDENGVAKIKLNGWEEGVLAEESEAPDFVCWIRNPSRGAWSLCIPYEINGETKPTYPDFIIVRSDPQLQYVIDILEPHNPGLKDNLGKAKAFAQYAEDEPRIGRIQLIRQGKDAAGKNRFKRLDLAQGATREKVIKAQNIEELDHIVETDGYFK